MTKLQSPKYQCMCITENFFMLVLRKPYNLDMKPNLSLWSEQHGSKLSGIKLHGPISGSVVASDRIRDPGIRICSRNPLCSQELGDSCLVVCFGASSHSLSCRSKSPPVWVYQKIRSNNVSCHMIIEVRNAFKLINYTLEQGRGRHGRGESCTGERWRKREPWDPILD
jgi:hypothetical protein